MIGLECLVLGDSIAVGTQQVRTECMEMAKGGINSSQWNRKYGERPILEEAKFNVVIISLGSNDHKGVNTRKELNDMRRKIEGKRVFWILPAIKPDVQEIVQQLAHFYGDTVIPITRLQKDGVHPSWAGYKEIAEKTK